MNILKKFRSSAPLLALMLSGLASAATLSVGPGKAYSVPCHAFSAAGNGDIVEIDASGTYNGDVCGVYPNNLTIRGVNGRPKINANGANSMGKGTWVISGTGTVIENVEMFGASVPDQNGAAIRLDGRDLTVRGSYLHDNENGILTGNDGVSNVVIENSEFSSNGFGDGYTHNLYIGHVNSLVFKNSYSHDAKVGHNLKSRATTNTIVYSRFSSSVHQPSYEVNLPNAGTSYVIGNVIQQPAGNNNPAMLAYGEEGASNTGNDLYVVNNTFINDDSSRGTFIMTGGSVGVPVLMQNNLFVGTGTVNTQGNATDRSNYRTLSPAFIDRANFDLRPASGSPVINAGTAAGSSASGLSLLASSQYKHVASSETRTLVGAIDIGAYEASGSAASVPTTTAPPPVATTPTPVAPTPTPVAPTPAPVTPAATTTNWVNCAGENGTCSFSVARWIRYGANSSYGYKWATGSITCINDDSGDPINGVVRDCSYADTSIAGTAIWTTCSGEGGTCSFSGTHPVRYGANGVYATKSATGAIACNNDVFGDPSIGVVKSCAFQN